MARENIGRWTNVFTTDFNAVVVHASLLPNGRVLYWGRRENPKAAILTPESLNEHFTKAYVWTPPTWVAPVWDDPTKKFKESNDTPISGKSNPTLNEPLPLNWNKNPKEKVNLFCSGHCFLPDGRLLIVGGHISDNTGSNQACTYDYQSNMFKASVELNGGRWYPSALPLPDGSALVLSGCKTGYNKDGMNNVPEIWPPQNAMPTTWTELTDPYFRHELVLPLYPRVHLNAKGQVFMVGPQAETWLLQLKDDKGNEVKTLNVPTSKGPLPFLGKWTSTGLKRNAGFRDWATSVMYANGKVLYCGGGSNPNDQTAATSAEFIDLNSTSPTWTMTNMQFARKQFNATVLPDGTVLVTGGTRGGGFNNLSGKLPVHEAELWDPAKNTDEDPKVNPWTTMAAENSDRCYHSIALLLPDGRVLSAGGGEWQNADEFDNDPKRVGPKQNLTDGQLFEPPYLFKGPRPIISSPLKDGPVTEIEYNKPFSVTVGINDSILKVSLVRLGSVTHCCNMNQQLIFLEKGFAQSGSKVTLLAPENAEIAPPGHYMLFVLSKNGVPSEARIFKILPLPLPVPDKSSATTARVADVAQHTIVTRHLQPSLSEHNEKIIAEQDGLPVDIGITPLCPYGLGACWAGAHDALQKLSDVQAVQPVSNQEDSLASVYLRQDILPDIDVWRSEFAKVIHGGYIMRGIEITVSGKLIKRQSGAQEQITMASTSTRPQLVLAPFQPASQLKWDMAAKATRPITNTEAEAYHRLSATLTEQSTGVMMQVTGTLQKHGAGDFSLDVREFEVQENGAS